MASRRPASFVQENREDFFDNIFVHCSSGCSVWCKVHTVMWFKYHKGYYNVQKLHQDLVSSLFFSDQTPKPSVIGFFDSKSRHLHRILTVSHSQHFYIDQSKNILSRFPSAGIVDAWKDPFLAPLRLLDDAVNVLKSPLIRSESHLNISVNF